MDQTQKSKGERIAKVMARAGVCSRRDAEKLIEAGKVSVNGEILQTPAFLVQNSDSITVNGEPLATIEDTRLFLYNKPSGLVTTAKDEKGRKTIFDDLPDSLPRLISVGRLDLNTEGLLLLTNDGGLSRFLELPANGWIRTYKVRVFGSVSQNRLNQLKDGLRYEGVNYGPITARLVSDKETQVKEGKNKWITVSISEGKNREVRKIMEALDLQVSRLIRISYGPFELGNLQQSSVQEIPAKTLRKACAQFFKNQKGDQS